MRWLAPVVLGACQFAHGVVPSGDGGAGSDVVDGAMTDTSAVTARVRLIDLDDAKVTGGPHVDFPLLVSISAPWLRARSSGGDVERSDGFDIHFSADQAGAMQLAHEVELYAPDTGTLVAWVKIPSLVPQSVVYLHYGDTAITTDPSTPSAVWSGGYQLVMHLDVVADATGKNTLAAANAGATAGRIDQAHSFDGSVSRIDAGSAAAIDNLFAGGGTAEAWFYAESFGEDSYGRFFDKGNEDGWSLFVNDGDVTKGLGFVHGSAAAGWGQWNAPANSVSLDTWHHVALVYNKSSSANDPTIYLDGAAVAVSELTAPSGAMDSDASIGLDIGNRAGLDRTFDGQLDEMRLSGVLRSAGWIATGYRNQADPASFYTVSAPL